MAEIPDFNFVSFYYAEQLAAMIARKAIDWPEHTETDPHDPVIQILRLFALIGHGHATRLDHVAREQFLSTLRLRSSLLALAALFDYRLAPPSPAGLDVLADLSGAGAQGLELLRAHSLAGTEGTTESPAVVFEYDSDDAVILVDGTGTWPLFAATNHAVPAEPVVEIIESYPTGAITVDASTSYSFAFGNSDLQFNKLRVVMATPFTAGQVVRWEYFDDSRILPPDAVVDLSGSIRFNVTTLVGAGVASTGTPVLVTCLRTGQQETGFTAVGGGQQRVTVTGTLGQSTVSESAGDYLVQTEWPELPGLVDGTAGLSVSGDVTFTLPQALDRRWSKTTLIDDADPGLQIEGYFVRARIITPLGSGSAPSFSAPTEPRRTTWTLMWEALQGQRVVERLGSTDGEPAQAFALGRSPFLTLTSVVVGEETWEEVRNFLASTPFDRHYTRIEQPDGQIVVTFGDGERGRIPTADEVVVATYRIGGGTSGNVGPGSVTRDRTGNSRLTNVRNPRAGAGWVAQEASTPAGLEVARAAVPASLRTGGRVVTPDDAVTLGLEFRTEDAGVVAVRAAGIEEGAGPKTIQLVCVAPDRKSVV